MSDYMQSAMKTFEVMFQSSQDVDLHWSGLNIWINGLPLVNEYSASLISFGCKWSEKRQAWYLRDPEENSMKQKRA